MIDAQSYCAADRGGARPVGTTALRQQLRRTLPEEAFAPCPQRLLAAFALAGAIAGLSYVLARVPLPAYAAVPLALVCGGLYGSLFFLGHEAGHGAVVRARRCQTLLMWVAFLIFVLSPSLWRVWHNKVHHAHTNHAAQDPDNFGSLDSYYESGVVRLAAALTPGSGRWLSVFYLPTWFTVHSQLVLWRQSRRGAGFASLNRRRAIAESLAMVAFWLALGWQLGPRLSLLVIVLPMLAANATVMSYIVTNHLLRPLADDGDQLSTSMSVSTHRWLDFIHFNFSHHVEHHLFPGMSSKYFPLVRAELAARAAEHYFAPPHWQALRMVYATPRFHTGHGQLVDPASGRAASIAAITEALRRPADAAGTTESDQGAAT